MGASFASSSFSPTFGALSSRFGISTEATTQSLSLFVLGFASGPLVSTREERLFHFSHSRPSWVERRFISLAHVCVHGFSPQSPNSTGERYEFFQPTSSSASSSLALRQPRISNSNALPIFRWLDGLSTNFQRGRCHGGLWSDHDQALAVVDYSVAVIGGPTVGPLVASAITNSYMKWRWTEYITSFLIFTIFIVDLFLLSETYAVSRIALLNPDHR
jgi:DHA1 family multidrug resistance protein-like MFS transporter